MKTTVYRSALAGIVLFLGTSNPSVARAAAYYHAYVSGRLEITQIGTSSGFEPSTPIDDADVSGFVITVDPDFEIPELMVQKEPDVATGFGDYSASAGSRVGLAAADPFNIGVGDSLSIYAGAEGRAGHGAVSYASSSTSVSSKLHVINDTEYEILVDTRWSSCEDLYFEGLGFLGESAWAFHSMEPPFTESCWVEPVVYRYAPGTTSELRISASAGGNASVVPEPSSVFIWSTIGALGMVCVFVQSRRQFGSL